MLIKLLCLANGDNYQDIKTDLIEDEFKMKVGKGEWVEVESNNKRIAINSQFIISYEIGESKLKVI